jgi:UDPglucose--hexose-1-phosphate uridylyltransferase
MSDFQFLHEPSINNWIISAPKRAKRPDQAKGVEPKCPFEPEFVKEIYKIGEARVIPNKYPFAPIHEIIIHSDDHAKNFDELPLEKVEDIFKVYRDRFDTHKNSGQVYIFHNQGKNAGESLPHPHTQLTVVPRDVSLKIPALKLRDEELKVLNHYYIFCPNFSEWPDEVWVAPKRGGRSFNEANSDEIHEISFIVSRLVQIFTLRYGHDFPFNFYIYPGQDWYLRLIPRVKTLGGFEVGTKVYVNTGVPKETFEFIKDNFDNPDFEKIKAERQAEFEKSV